MAHFIRIEAVNIYSAIADTDNISVIRGGSLLLKQPIDDIAAEFTSKLEAISTGASIGVFKVKPSNDTIRQVLIDYLNQGPAHPKNKRQDYRYFTFVVEEYKAQSYPLAKEVLIARCRYAQLQQISLSADYATADKSAVPCELEGIRPATKTTYWPDDKTKKTSDFINLKRQYGIEQRSKLYQDELSLLDPDDTDTKDLKQLNYTPDLDQLSCCKQFSNLDGKVAFIYFDGNRFSKLQNKLVNTEDDQKEFDRQIKNLRRKFLKILLQQAALGNSKLWGIEGKIKDQEKWLIRLETLLWGGDEMLFVVPAWQGFELLQLFYQCSKDWRIKIGDKTSEVLTHAGGMVFCYHKTPIYKVRNLAQNLADSIKDSAQGRYANYFDYLILESIDYPAESLNEFFKHKYGQLAEFRCYLNPEKLKPSPDMLNGIIEYLPKSQIYAIARAACQIQITRKESNKPNILTLENYKPYEQQVERLCAISASAENAQTSINHIYQIFQAQISTPPTLQNSAGDEIEEQQLIQQAIAWLHLVELWDYFINVSLVQGVHS